ncbi:hypothetical protein Tco_0535509 [Tanacetum coccineum]
MDMASKIPGPIQLSKGLDSFCISISTNENNRLLGVHKAIWGLGLRMVKGLVVLGTVKRRGEQDVTIVALVLLAGKEGLGLLFDWVLTKKRDRFKGYYTVSPFGLTMLVL